MKTISTYDFSNPNFAEWLQRNMAADEIHIVGIVRREQLKPLDVCFTMLQGKVVDISKLSIILPDWAIKYDSSFIEVFFSDLQMDLDLSKNLFEKLYLNTDYATRFVFHNDYILSEDGICLAAAHDSRSIVIPDSVTYIGHTAFAAFTKMTSVQFHDSITKIGKLAFAYVHNLSSVVLPSSLQELSYASFFLCEGLKSLVLPEGLTEIPCQCFRYCEIEEINFPSSLRAIRADAFHAGLTMDYVALPEGLEILESGSFATSVDRVHLPSTLKQCDEDWYYDSIVGEQYNQVRVC